MESLEIIVFDKLLLRTWEKEDAPALFAITDKNREYLAQWLPWLPFVQNVQDSKKFIQDAQSNWAQQATLELGIWRGQELVGCIGLHELNRMHDKTSIGYWLGAEFQGQGIMTQAVQALVNYSFEELEFHRVEIRAAVENAASRAIPKRLGFQQEGILREAERVNGRYLDTVVFSMLKKDWDRVGSQSS